MDGAGAGAGADMDEMGARAGPAVGATEAGEVSRRRQQLFEEREALSELEGR